MLTGLYLRAHIVIAEDQIMVSPGAGGPTGARAAAAGHDAIADIAARLYLAPGTVRKHLSAAIQKLGARNRAEAVAVAQRKGWL